MQEKRIGIMQPYFFPYIGYFHLISAVDAFVVYDNLKYTKRGWINRNRFLERGSGVTFSIPLRKASDSLNIDQRQVADSFDREKLLRRVADAYRKAPHFESVMSLFTRAVRNQERNLFRYIRDSLAMILEHLEITTPMVASSEIAIDHGLRGQDKVIAICKALGATTYVNAIGGTDLYEDDVFAQSKIELRFVESRCRPYLQFNHPFVPWLSILDVLMFNPSDVVRDQIRDGFSTISKSMATV